MEGKRSHKDLFGLSFEAYSTSYSPGSTDLHTGVLQLTSQPQIANHQEQQKIRSRSSRARADARRHPKQPSAHKPLSQKMSPFKAAVPKAGPPGLFV